jgi:hypothetical protein
MAKRARRDATKAQGEKKYSRRGARSNTSGNTVRKSCHRRSTPIHRGHGDGQEADGRHKQGICGTSRDSTQVTDKTCQKMKVAEVRQGGESTIEKYEGYGAEGCGGLLKSGRRARLWGLSTSESTDGS